MASEINVERSIKLTKYMINLLIEKMQTVVSHMKLSDCPSANELENVKEGLNSIGDWSMLLRGHLNILKTELGRDDDDQQQEGELRQGQTVKD